MEKFSRVLRGYDPEEVNNFLDKVIEKVESMVSEIEAKDKKIVELSNLDKQTKEKYNLELNKLKQENLTLTSKIAQFERMEENLKRAILMAEKTSEQIKLTAYQERDIIVTDAKKNANRIVNEALLKAEEVQKETDTLRRNIIIFKRRLKEALSTMNTERKARRTPTNECSTCTSEATATTVWQQCEGKQSRRDCPSDYYTVEAVWLAEAPEVLAEAFRATPEELKRVGRQARRRWSNWP